MSSFLSTLDPTISQDYTGGNAEREKDLLKLHGPAPPASLNSPPPGPGPVSPYGRPASPPPEVRPIIQSQAASPNSHYPHQNYQHHPDPTAEPDVRAPLTMPPGALTTAEAAARDRNERTTTVQKRLREWEDDDSPARKPSTVNNDGRTQRQWGSRETILSPSEHGSLEQHKQINDSALSHSIQPHTKKRKLQDADLSAPTLFHNSSESQDVVESLLLQVESLEKENAFLQTQITPEARNARKSKSHPWILVHSVNSELYVDAPQWKQVQDDSWDLESRKRISNFEVFLERQRLVGVAFVATLQYDRYDTRHRCHLTEPPEQGEFEDSCQRTTQQIIQATVRPVHVSIHFLCEVLGSAWKHLLNMDENLKKIYDVECELEIDSEASYIHQDLPNAEAFFYHFHTSLQKIISAMEASDEKWRLNLLIRFMEDFFRDEYQEVNDLLKEGLVSGVYIKYLSAPGTVLISHENGNDIGYLQTSFFWDASTTKRMAEVMSWKFDGKFKMKEENITIDVEGFDYTPREIASFKYCPLKYADPHTVEKLRNRGHTFWRSRKSAYVSYTGLDMNKEVTYDDTRFVVDVRTYGIMHPSKAPVGESLSESAKMRDATMGRDQPPDDGAFVYLVPASIYGFDIQEKKWVNLQVDNIRQLEWNTEAFESLAIDKDSKELINALVNNKIAAEKATDMVRGKGNGLIILLHGGPGTGKTLTAESVAEIAKKPLYRVTCGDIGTAPREVEKYLQQVFHLGKIWDCVVLLDEADVFLEQRTLSDLSRNALVSVFLRTLEYYDGILILTSNRVGTFDEAFKSRIQLALHYPNLDLAQRKQIWKNFTHRLDSLEEDVDVDAILASINKLAKYEMNGRQIRNAITTARQLALFKKETLTTKHLEHSIRVSGKFDQYLEEVHNQIKDDEMARESGVR